MVVAELNAGMTTENVTALPRESAGAADRLVSETVDPD